MAEVVLHMAEGVHLKSPERMLVIFEKTKLMLRKVLLAFVELDLKLAEAVLAMDDEVDALCKSELPLQIELMKHEPNLVEQRLMLLSVCRQLERIGDHASDIAEDIVYLLSGEIIRHSISGSCLAPLPADRRRRRDGRRIPAWSEARDPVVRPGQPAAPMAP